MRWPLEGATYVFWGGETAKVNAHIDNDQQRRALDLCAIYTAGPAAGRTFRGAGTDNADYLVWGRTVRAAASGAVHIAIDGVPDNPPGRLNGYVAPGNLVVVDRGNGEYAHYAHLQRGSVAVKAGDAVKAGQVLGRVGNSGQSSEPHLHFHVQDNAAMPEGCGLRPIFEGVEVERNGGRRAAARYAPRKGDVVRIVGRSAAESGRRGRRP